MNKLTILLSSLLFLSGCSSAIYFTSSPKGATVIQYNPRNGEKEILCKTPCTKTISYFDTDKNFYFVKSDSLPDMKILTRNSFFINEPELHGFLRYVHKPTQPTQQQKINLGSTCSVHTTNYLSFRKINKKQLKGSQDVLEHQYKQNMLKECSIDEKFLSKAEKKFKDDISLKLAIEKEAERQTNDQYKKKQDEEYNKQLNEYNDQLDNFYETIFGPLPFQISLDELL